MTTPTAATAKSTRSIPLESDRPMPEGVLEAFWAYDAALLSNDLEGMDRCFAQNAETIRGDGQNVAVGIEAIRSFRAGRGSAPTRRVTAVHARVISDEAVLLVAEVASPTGGPGQQTQLWQLLQGQWRATAAHVTAPQVPVDRSIWRAAGAPLLPPDGEGPLRGETVAVKDLFAVRGFPMGGGVPELLAEREPEAQHAPAVEALSEAGASITGIAQTDQFAFGLGGMNAAYGTPANLSAPGCLPGGSSSGSATAVRAGQVSIGLGTDTAGSIRVPASYQGLWSLRSTHGAISTERMVPLAPSFDAVGWLTRDGETLARVSEVLLPQDGRSSLNGLAVDSALLRHGVDPEVREAFDRWAVCVGAGRIDLNGDQEGWLHAFRAVQAREAWDAHGTWIEEHPGALGAGVEARFRMGSAISDEVLEAERAVVCQGREAIRAAIGDQVLALPAAPGAPASLAAPDEQLDQDRARTLRLTFLASLAGLPVVTAPLLKGAQVGVCLIGPAGSDSALIAFARGLAG